MIYDSIFSFEVESPRSAGEIYKFASPAQLLIAGASPSVPFIVGDGGIVDWEVEVTEAFVASGTPICHIVLAVSDNQSFATNVSVIAMAQCGIQLVTTFSIGLNAADLALGARYVLRPAPWTFSQKSIGADITQSGQVWLNLGIHLINNASTHFFTAGKIVARPILGSSTPMRALDRMFPSRMRVQ